MALGKVNLLRTKITEGCWLMKKAICSGTSGSLALLDSGLTIVELIGNKALTSMKIVKSIGILLGL